MENCVRQQKTPIRVQLIVAKHNIPLKLCYKYSFSVNTKGISVFSVKKTS